MTEIAFNAELLIFQFVVGDDEYGQSLIIRHSAPDFAIFSA
ncbi:hypothetical protein [Aeromonas caviae]|nr:hypothetical protein [Aeromonas caviae]